MGVMFRAGQRDHGGEFAPPIVRRVAEIPVEDVVQDRQRGRIAGAGGQHDLLDGRQGLRHKIDLLAAHAIVEQLLVPREDDFLDGVRGPHEACEQHLLRAAYRLVADQVRPDLHGRDDAFALTQPQLDKPAEGGLEMT